jgi:hypothetical protein
MFQQGSFQALSCPRGSISRLGRPYRLQFPRSDSRSPRDKARRRTTGSGAGARRQGTRLGLLVRQGSTGQRRKGASDRYQQGSSSQGRTGHVPPWRLARCTLCLQGRPRMFRHPELQVCQRKCRSGMVAASGLRRHTSGLQGTVLPSRRHSVSQTQLLRRSSNPPHTGRWFQPPSLYRCKPGRADMGAAPACLRDSSCREDTRLSRPLWLCPTCSTSSPDIRGPRCFVRWRPLGSSCRVGRPSTRAHHLKLCACCSGRQGRAVARSHRQGSNC